MIVSIHQPNYLPWLGYFLKMARSDVFMFLDDVQFSKNGYINRTRVLRAGQLRWLTIPVSYNFGDAIRDVTVPDEPWRSRHLDTLRTCYGSAPYFRETWTKLGELYDGLADEGLASINRGLVEGVAGLLGLTCQVRASSAVDVGELVGDDRLVALVKSVEGATAYLSGRGGANYQEPAKFSHAHIELQYNDFQHPRYEQTGSGFIEGLSVIDAAFHLGWDGTAELLSRLVADA